MSAIRKALENPYTVAVTLMAADGTARKLTGRGLPGVSKALRWQYRRIAALEAPWGKRLDELGATMGQARWVASPGLGKKGRNLEVEARYQALVAFLEKRSEHESFRALTDAFPTIDPRTGLTVPLRVAS